MWLSDSLLAPCLPIGVDIGASGVRLLQLRRSAGGLSVVAAARVELERQGDALDSAARARAIAQGVRGRVRSGGFSGVSCVVSLDNRLVRVRSLRLPPMPDDEVDRAVRLDAPLRLGFGAEEGAEVVWVRAGPVRQSGDPRDEVLVIGAQRAPIERLVFALASEGLRPLAVEPSFSACARTHTRRLRRTADQHVVRVIVDIGHATTGVIVTRGESVAFYKQLEVGGLAMTRSAAERLGIEPQTVAEMRRQRALATSCGAGAGDAKVDRALFEGVRPVIGELANEVSLCLRYYGVTFRGGRPESCLVVGGEAGEPRLTEVFAEALHVRVSAGRPLEGIDVSRAVGAVPGWESLDAPWSVACGLSLRTWGRRSLRRDRAPDAAPVEQPSLDRTPDQERRAA